MLCSFNFVHRPASIGAVASLAAAVWAGLAACGAAHGQAHTAPLRRLQPQVTLTAFGGGPGQSSSKSSGKGVESRKAKQAAARAKAAAKAELPKAPDKRLTPEQVVRIQMEALQHNDSPKPDAGIATTFAFASPQNRLATGPLTHFAQIVKSPAYLPMLGCKKITYERALLEDDAAQQRVHIVAADGERITYLFMLSRQKDGPYAGCWMNDGCIREGAEARDHRFDA